MWISLRFLKNWAINPLMGIIVLHRTAWTWYTGRWWMGCYIWYSEEGTGRGHSLLRCLLIVPNVTAHPSTTRVPINVLLYNGPLLYGFNVPIKGLKPGRLIFLSHLVEYSVWCSGLLSCRGRSLQAKRTVTSCMIVSHQSSVNNKHVNVRYIYIYIMYCITQKKTACSHRLFIALMQQKLQRLWAWNICASTFNPVECRQCQIEWYEVGTLPVDGWAVTFGTASRPQPAQAPSRCTKCNSPSINGQWTSHRVGI